MKRPVFPAAMLLLVTALVGCGAPSSGGAVGTEQTLSKEPTSLSSETAPRISPVSKPAETSSSSAVEPDAAVRVEPKAAWAQTVELPGCPNLHKVDDMFYRGGQPTAEGFRKLKELGIRTVINLRALHSDREEIGKTDLAYEEISVKAWHPEDEDLVRFLRIVTDKNRAPFFVHCQYGSDRTGTMMAVYRIVIQGWTKDEAIAEMTQGGLGFHPTWENLVDYVRRLDVETIRRRAGLEKAEPVEGR